MFYARLTTVISNLLPKSPSGANIWFDSLSCFVLVQRSLSTTKKMASPLPKEPLVWIDCEMTGLDLSKDRILEIAVGSHRSAFGQNPR